MYIKLYQQRFPFKEPFVTQLLSDRLQLLVSCETTRISGPCHQRSQPFYSHIYLSADEKEQDKLSAIWNLVRALLARFTLVLNKAT